MHIYCLVLLSITDWFSFLRVVARPAIDEASTGPMCTSSVRFDGDERDGSERKGRETLLGACLCAG